MVAKLRRRIVTAALLASVVAVPAATGGTRAQSQAQPVVSIDDCTVKRSRNAGGFTWAYCPVVVDPINTEETVTVRYHVNLRTYRPLNVYDARSGTLRFPADSSLQNIKFAFRNLSVSQVRARLRVTLSSPRNAELGDATAQAD